MFLKIDTTDREFIFLSLNKADAVLAKAKVKAFRQQGEKLLPAINKLLKKNNFKLKDLEKIVVVNGAGSFSSLRIGIVTANALAYVLDIPVEDQRGKFIKRDGLQIVEPKYIGEANIGK
ncbi:MAG: tRNA (adenosine(37)-N6)-threonylcarbamoyltransferase complex dimerization subunit type 1 TsaB [Patescibacteria group bacterium]|nr:tRNA (adenosine(37)-N6)-threonylcarbamoyltransferase complex dimerization subunit type 1 TsaB [Patescibacteria group bacterium]